MQLPLILVTRMVVCGVTRFLPANPAAETRCPAVTALTVGLFLRRGQRQVQPGGVRDQPLSMDPSSDPSPRLIFTLDSTHVVA